MKKRWIAFLLAGTLAFGMCGCVQKETEDVPTAAPSLEIEPFTPASVELSAEGEVLLSFLNGETQAVVGEDFYNDLEEVVGEALSSAERLSFSELTQAVAACDLDRLGLEISYALLKTLSGREMLAVRYQDSSNPGFSYGCYAIFGVYDQEIRLTYAEDYWNRSNTQLCQDLVFLGSGSGGAGDHFEWCGYIDDTGHYRVVYEIESLGGPWVAMYASSVFDSMDTDWAMDCTCDILTTEEGGFYELQAGVDTDPEKLALLREYLEQKGMTEIDSVEEAVAQAMETHGVSEFVPFDDWTAWVEPAVTSVVTGEVVVDALEEWVDEGLWEELSERQQKLLENLPARELPKEAVEGRTDRESVWEDTLFPMCYDEKNDVTLYAVIQEDRLNEEGYWSDEGIVLRVGDRTKYYPICHLQNWVGGTNPLMVVRDLNGDGKDEAAVSFFCGQGSGASVSILYIFDLETLEYETMDLSGLDLSVAYDPATHTATLYSGTEEVTVDIPGPLEDWSFTACAGQVIHFAEKDGKLFGELAVDFSGRTWWYLATATGEVVYEDGRYTLGPLTLEAVA